VKYTKKVKKEKEVHLGSRQIYITVSLKKELIGGNEQG